MKLNRVHHVAVICRDYVKSLRFYTDILGLEILAENYREEQKGYKTDLGLNGEYIIELFSFENAPDRLSHPEAAGLRHLAFEVDSIVDVIKELESKGLSHEPVRTDGYTGLDYFFISDPDGLPIEFYQKSIC